MKKQRLLISFFILCFSLLLFTPITSAQRGASSKLGLLNPTKGGLGYANEAHEYIYAFKEEPEIHVQFTMGNAFDFDENFPPVETFIVVSGVYAKNILPASINMQGITYYPIDDPFIQANHAARLQRAIAELDKVDIAPAAVLLIPQEKATQWSGQTIAFSYTAKYGGGSDFGFAEAGARGISIETITYQNATSSMQSTYLLKEPVLGMEVIKKILDNGTPVDEKEVQLGDEIAYQITIKNTSEIWLEDLVLQDDLFGKNITDLQIDGTPASLGSDDTLKLVNQKGTKGMMSGRGKDIVVTYIYTVTEADIVIQNGKAAIPNEAKVSATTPTKSYDMTTDRSGAYPYVGAALSVVKPVSGKDDCLLTLGDAEPSLSIEKTVSPTTVSVGDSVSYQVKVTNNSPFGVKNILVVDTLSPNAGDFINGQCVIDFLAAGESKVLSYPYIAAAADVQNGQINNTATAGLGDYSVSSSATLLVRELPSPSPSESASPSQEPTPSYTASENPASSGSNRPGTGDSTNIWDYIVLCVSCLFAIGLIYYLLRRGKKQ